MATTTRKKTEEVNIQDLAEHLKTISKTLLQIEKRLAKLEESPLHNGARIVSDGAKAFTESAREVYDRVEARRWFDRSYDAASKVCDTVSEQFKTWWESHQGKTGRKKSEHKDKD